MCGTAMQFSENAAQPQRRTLQQHLNDPVILSFAPLPNQELRPTSLMPEHSSPEQHTTVHTVGVELPDQTRVGQGLRLQYSAVKAALPPNVQLITLKAMPEGSVLLRLAHLYQARIAAVRLVTLSHCCFSVACLMCFT